MYINMRWNVEGLITEWLYNKIFHTDYNLSFHHLQKDQNDTCFLFNQSENEIKEEYENYIDRKNLAYKLKDEIKSIVKDQLSTIRIRYGGSSIYL